MKKRLFWILLVCLFQPGYGQIIFPSSLSLQIRQQILAQQQLTGDSAKMWTFLEYYPMSPIERQLMEYLYAFMPLSDLVTYSPSFFYANVKQTLQAKQDMSWGNQIPENIFLHYVLPVRVNNEPLDSFRLVIYPVLKQRVQGLNMAQAALEINHWCHEKVTYRCTDARTGSPMSLLLRACGRCGEESIFTVAALRAVGIPARQVYTPRWAHTDDNHAWVEVWINGKWHYMGGCEPEPCLDRAWFSEPVKRAMLVQTFTFGPDAEDSSAIRTTNRFSELNLTYRYAPVKKVVIHVTDSLGHPVDSARVEWRLYNYASFYPILKTYTDVNGNATATLGKGDILVWVIKGEQFCFKEMDIRTMDTLRLILSPKIPVGTYDFDMVPPVSIHLCDTLNTIIKEQNYQRLRTEDSIRHVYMSTFKDDQWVTNFANRYFLSPDTVRDLLVGSEGNWPQISAYLAQNAFVSPAYVVALASQLSEKDLGDITSAVLTDHLLWATKPEYHDPSISNDDFIHYVLSPRISIEEITPWRSFLIRHFGDKMARACRKDITPLIQWIRDSIRITRTANQISNMLIAPEKVFTYRIADMRSRDLFFVAACRSFGIPSRLNPQTHEPEFQHKGEWFDVDFNTGEASIPVRGKIKLLDCKNRISPQYGHNFTLGQFHDGHYRTLPYEGFQRIGDFPDPLPVDTGRYVLTTGVRLADGSVLSSIQFFRVSKGDEVHLPVTLRQYPNDIYPLGKIDLSAVNVRPAGQASSCSLASLVAGKKEIAIVLFDPDQEPSRHVLQDLAMMADQFHGRKMMFVYVFSSPENIRTGTLSSFSLPTPNVIVIDQQRSLSGALSALFPQLLSNKLPIVVLCDGDGTLFFKSAGYCASVPNQLFNIQRQLHSVSLTKEDREACH